MALETTATFIGHNQSFVQKGIGVKYIDYDYSPTQ